jgi:hypothetical protein
LIFAGPLWSEGLPLEYGMFSRSKIESIRVSSFRTCSVVSNSNITLAGNNCKGRRKARELRKYRRQGLHLPMRYSGIPKGVTDYRWKAAAECTRIQSAGKMGGVQFLVTDYERDEPLLRAEMVIRFARNPEISSDELLGLDLAKKNGGSNASWEYTVDGKRVRNFLVNCPEPANGRRRQEVSYNCMSSIVCMESGVICGYRCVLCGRHVSLHASGQMPICQACRPKPHALPRVHDDTCGLPPS